MMIYKLNPWYSNLYIYDRHYFSLRSKKYYITTCDSNEFEILIFMSELLACPKVNLELLSPNINPAATNFRFQVQQNHCNKVRVPSKLWRYDRIGRFLVQTPGLWLSLGSQLRFPVTFGSKLE